MNDTTTEPQHVLILRTCKADMSSFNGFRWPTAGPVEAPDWNPQPVCGGGLHGALWGEGDSELFNWSDDAKWLVVRVPEAAIVDLNGKVKFPRGEVVCCGDRAEATQYIAAHGANGRPIIGLIAAAGNRATLTGGNRATLTGGDEATLTGGNRATLTGGDEATLTGGDEATLTGGDEATLTGGYKATLTGGDKATLTGGYKATLIAKWWDTEAQHIRFTIGYIGEDGLLPNVAYHLNGQHQFKAVPVNP